MITVRENPHLRELTTLRLGGAALALVSLEREQDLEALPETLWRLGGTPAVIGRGSNILADDRGLPWVLVRPAIKTGPEIVAAAERVLVRVGAGIALPRLLAWAAAAGLSGLEGLAGVPGAIGGAVAMNAGSYGCEIGQSLHALRVFSPMHGVVDLQPGGFVAQYRGMTLPGLDPAPAWWLACAATFSLTREKSDIIRARMDAWLARKRATQPVDARSAGCVFKNPEGYSAGKLLDDAGFRGKRLGGMAFSGMHANFLVNEGEGTSAAALELLENARDAVRVQYGVMLQTEVKIWRSI